MATASTGIRARAATALGDVLRHGRKPRHEIDERSRLLDGRDRAFLMELLYGTLRHLMLIDRMLDAHLKSPGSLPGPTRDALRIGAYQLFFTRVPERAAVNEAVQSERTHKGLVNGVLRNLIRTRGAHLAMMDRLRADALGSSGEAAAIDALSLLTSHPRWLASRWYMRFGSAGALALMEADNSVPPLVLRACPLRTTRDALIGELSAAGIDASPTAVSPSGIRVDAPVSEIARFLDRAMVQDEAAQLCSIALAPEPGMRVLDACAAPGGKTGHLAELIADTGEVLAVESDPARIAVLRENIARMGYGSVRIAVADVTDRAAMAGYAGAFDRVMVDAPCSSLGVVRRKPDVKYRHTEESLAGFGETQLAILRAASMTVKPGGALLFATCSTEPEEGEQVISEFLKSSGKSFIIERMPLMSGDSGMARTYPNHGSMDGFFMALVRRAG